MPKNRILEISKRANQAGRVPITIALHEIYTEAKDVNDNGLHWMRPYVEQAMSTVEGMPICASFFDSEKEVPYDHGFTGIEQNREGLDEPYFENSVVVGTFESASIQDLTINGRQGFYLVGEGYLYNQRYPKFVDWIRENRATGHVDTSVEIMGLASNDNKIVYAEEHPTNAYRTPKIYAYSGCAVLSVVPADRQAIVLEVAQKHEEERHMEFTIDDIKAVVAECLASIGMTQDQFDTQLAELNQKLEQHEATIAERDSTIEDLNNQLSEANARIEGFAAVESELNELKKAQAITEMEQAIAEYSEDEQKFAESEINSYREDPLAGDIEAIKAKICVGIVETQKEEARVAEQNEKHDDNIDIFSEVNDSHEDDDDEDVNIF